MSERHEQAAVLHFFETRRKAEERFARRFGRHAKRRFALWKCNEGEAATHRWTPEQGRQISAPVLEEAQFGPAAPQSQHLEPPGRAWNSFSSSIEPLIRPD